MDFPVNMKVYLLHVHVQCHVNVYVHPSCVVYLCYPLIMLIQLNLCIHVVVAMYGHVHVHVHTVLTLII